MVKCNFDAGFNVSSSQGTSGWIIRDYQGNPKAWGASKLPNASTPLEVETKALLMAMQQTWIRGFKQVHFEGDCETLINTIHGLSKHSELANLLLDIDYWSSKFSSVIFTFTRRAGNSVAYNLASFISSQGNFYSNSVYKPMWLKRLIC